MGSIIFFVKAPSLPRRGAPASMSENDIITTQFILNSKFELSYDNPIVLYETAELINYLNAYLSDSCRSSSVRCAYL